MSTKCLYCYKPLEEGENDFHSHCSKKFFGTPEAPKIDFGIDDIYELAKENINKHLTVTGVQKKISIGLSKNTGKERLTITNLEGLSNFILKTPTDEYPELPEVESLTMHLADLSGLNTVPHSLIKLKSTELAYITRRIDRYKNKKLHMEDMCQLSEKLSEDKYDGSYEYMFKIIKKHLLNSYESSPSAPITLQSIRLFELITFCFITGNDDMHLKNFSLIENKSENFELSPAYDLLSTALFIKQNKEESALTFSGKKNKFGKKDFYTFGERIDLTEKQVSNAIKTITTKLSKSNELIDRSFLSEEMKESYKELIQSRIQRLSE